MKFAPLAESPAWMDGNVIHPKRFDTGYYDPALTRAEAYFRNPNGVEWKRLRDVGTVYNFGAYELTNQIRFVDKAASSAVPFITVSNIHQLTVDFESTPWIDANSHRLLSVSTCRPETVLLSIAGTIGKAGVVPATYPECNGNQAIAKISVNDERSDPYFLAAYLSSDVGAAAAKREAAGAVQKNLYIYNVEEIPVPCPPRRIRVSIGNKLRAAERLRTEASQARNEIDRWLNDCLPSWDEPREQLAVVPSFDNSFSPERLDAWFNHIRFHELDQALSTCDSLVPLSAVATLVQDRWNSCDGSIEYIEIGAFDLAHGTARGKVIDARSAPSRAQIASEIGDVAVSLVRPNRQNIVSIQGTGSRQIVVTSGCDVLRFESTEIAALYSIVLRHDAITHQIMRWNTGTSYPAIEGLPLGHVLVPSIPENRRRELCRYAVTAIDGAERAQRLVIAAVDAVDQLVDGTLREADCVSVGRQLADEFDLEVPR